MATHTNSLFATFQLSLKGTVMKITKKKKTNKSSAST